MENKITKDLSEEELIIIRGEVSKYMIEGDLVNPPLCLLLVKNFPFDWPNWGVSEAVQCAGNKEIEGDSVL